MSNTKVLTFLLQLADFFLSQAGHTKHFHFTFPICFLKDDVKTVLLT